MFQTLKPGVRGGRDEWEATFGSEGLFGARPVYALIRDMLA
jgi:hypothetical protein